MFPFKHDIHEARRSNHIKLISSFERLLSMEPRENRTLSHVNMILFTSVDFSDCRCYCRFVHSSDLNLMRFYFERHCVKCGNDELSTVTTRRVNRIFTTCQPCTKPIYKVHAIFNFPRFSLALIFRSRRRCCRRSREFLLSSCHSLSTHR